MDVSEEGRGGEGRRGEEREGEENRGEGGKGGEGGLAGSLCSLFVYSLILFVCLFVCLSSIFILGTRIVQEFSTALTAGILQDRKNSTVPISAS